MNVTRMPGWLAVLLLVVGGAAGAVYLAPDLPPFFKGPPRGPKEQADKAARELRHGYDALAEVSQWVHPGEVHLPETVAPLLPETRELYRAATDAYQAKRVHQGAELALAAKDAGRGLKHVVRGLVPQPADVPSPPPVQAGPPKGPGKKKPAPPVEKTPPAPWEEAYRNLEEAHRRLRDAGTESSEGPAGKFLAAGRAVYDLARAAYATKDYVKAAELARGAEAWTHVGEHWRKAQEPEPDAATDEAPPAPAAEAGEPPVPPTLDEAPGAGLTSPAPDGGAERP